MSTEPSAGPKSHTEQRKVEDKQEMSRGEQAEKIVLKASAGLDTTLGQLDVTRCVLGNLAQPPAPKLGGEEQFLWLPSPRLLGWVGSGSGMGFAVVTDGFGVVGVERSLDLCSLQPPRGLSVAKSCPSPEEYLGTQVLKLQRCWRGTFLVLQELREQARPTDRKINGKSWIAPCGSSPL